MSEKIGMVNQYDKDKGFQEVLPLFIIKCMVKEININQYINPFDIYTSSTDITKAIRLVIDCRNGNIIKKYDTPGSIDADECFLFEIFRIGKIIEIDEDDLFSLNEECYTFDFVKNPEKDIELFYRFYGYRFNKEL